MHYEITQDCRIGNTDYKAGQIVTKEEVGGLFFHVMKEADEAEAPKGKKKVDPKTSSKETETPENKGDEEGKEDEEADEEADEAEAPKGKKK